MERFWSKVNKDGPRTERMGTRCWVWTRSIKTGGYGQFMLRGRPMAAHVVAWEMEHGEPPVGKLFHRCDNPACVRPSHLAAEREPSDGSARFHEKVNKDGVTRPGMDSPCWEWTAHRNPGGYGEIRWGDRARLAHRVAWEMSTGKHPGNAFVCHRCDNPGCVRPSHLFLGDNAVNMGDSASKGRMGRKLTVADVRAIRAARVDAPHRTYVDIGHEFGVSGTMAGYIIRRVWWVRVQ